jgi:hypothetical protein
VSGPASEREAERQRRTQLRLRRWIQNEGDEIEREEDGQTQTVEFLAIFLSLAGFGCAQRQSASGGVGAVGVGWFGSFLRAPPPGVWPCGGLLRVAMLSVSGLAAPVAAFRRLVPCAVFNSVPGSDENSLGNRGGSPPVLRRIYFSFSELSSFSFSLGENDGFFLGN